MGRKFILFVSQEAKEVGVVEMVYILCSGEVCQAREMENQGMVECASGIRRVGTSRDTNPLPHREFPTFSQGQQGRMYIKVRAYIHAFLREFVT